MLRYPVVFGALGVMMVSDGCLERSFYITALPDNSAQIRYELRGDRIDLEDDRELFPDSTVWDVSRSVEEQKEETIHIYEASLSIPDLHDLNHHVQWKRSPGDSVFLARTLKLHRISSVFGSIYLFQGELHSRRFREHYGDMWDYIPKECRILDDPEVEVLRPSEEIEELERKFSLGVLQWNRVRYVRMFERTWRILKKRVPDLSDTSFTTYSISLAGWKNDLHEYMNTLDIPDPNYVNLEWWSNLRSLFLGRMVDLIGTDAILEAGNIADAIEMEYQISKDIQDDLFRFVIILPGWITRARGSDKKKNEVKWEISGKDIMNEDVVITAKSFDPSAWRIAAATLIIILILRTLRRMVIQPKKRTTS